MQSQLEQAHNTVALVRRAEEEARKKIDQLHFKINDQDKLIRERDEEIFSLTSERMNLSVDLKNARLTGDQLKQENH